MAFKERLAGTLIGLGICIVAIPVAVTVTIVLKPFWSWLEDTTAIETVGHSGPAGWCYLFIYIIVLTLAGVVWSKIERRHQKED